MGLGNETHLIEILQLTRYIQTIEMINSALSVFLFVSQDETIKAVPLTHGSKRVKNSDCLDKSHEVCEYKLVWLLVHMHVVVLRLCMYTQLIKFYIIFLLWTFI